MSHGAFKSIISAAFTGRSLIMDHDEDRYRPDFGNPAWCVLNGVDAPGEGIEQQARKANTSFKVYAMITIGGAVFMLALRYLF